MKRYLVAGLLIWVPLGVTFLILKLLVDLMDRTLVLIPEPYRSNYFDIPGLGVLLTFALLLITGVLAANFFGRRLVHFWEGVLSRIPLISPIYSSAKQVAETLLSDSNEAFKKVLLIQYPRKGVWSLAFQTSTELNEIQSRTQEITVCVFVPTTPNPTSGFIIIVPESEVVFLDMSVDEGLKMIISLGVVVPQWRGSTVPGPLERAPPKP